MGVKLLQEYVNTQNILEQNQEKLEETRDWVASAMLKHPRAGSIHEAKISWQMADCPGNVAIMVEIREYSKKTNVIFGFPLEMLLKEQEQGLAFELPEHRFRRTPSEAFALEQLPGVVYYLPGRMRNLPRKKGDIYPRRTFEFIMLDDHKLLQAPNVLLKIRIPNSALPEMLGDNDSELMRILDRDDIVRATWNVDPKTGAELLLVVDVDEARKRGLFRCEMIPSW